MIKNLKEDLKIARERLRALDKLTNKSCATCTNITCKANSNENLEHDEYPEGSKCTAWYNKDLILKSQKLNIYDINILKLK